MTDALDLTRETPVAPAAQEAAVEPIAATHLWCPYCREPKDARHKPVVTASRQHRRGWHGEHLANQQNRQLVRRRFREIGVEEGA